MISSAQRGAAGRVLSRFALVAVVVASVAVGLASRAVAADGAAAPGSEVLAPTVSAVVGTVEVRADGEESWSPVAAGVVLEPGDTVRTGARSKAEIVHPAGVIRMFERTVLRLPVESDGRVQWVRRPELFAGQSLFDVTPSRIGGLLSLVSTRVRILFEVVTPHVVAGVKGTRFLVAERGSRSVVGVYEGTVVASDQGRTPRDTVVLTWGQLAEYESGRLAGVRSVEFQDDWAAWLRPAVHRPRLDGGPGGGAGRTREARLDGGLVGGGDLDDGGRYEGGGLDDGGTTATAALGQPAGDSTGGLLDGTGDTVGGLLDRTGSTVGGLLDTAGGAVGGLLDTAGGVVGALTGTVGGTVGGLTGTVGGAVGGLTGTTGDGGGGLTGTVGGAVGGVTDTTGDVVGGLTDTAGGLLDSTTETVTDTVGGLTSTTGSLLESTTERLTGAGGGIIGTVGGLLGR